MLFIRILLLLRNDPTHAAAGVGNVPLPTRDQMHVHMEDCLTCLGPGVDPDIEACDGGVCDTNFLALFLEQRLDRVQLWLIEVEVIGHMPLGEGMSRSLLKLA